MMLRNLLFGLDYIKALGTCRGNSQFLLKLSRIGLGGSRSLQYICPVLNSKPWKADERDKSKQFLTLQARARQQKFSQRVMMSMGSSEPVSQVQPDKTHFRNFGTVESFIKMKKTSARPDLLYKFEVLARILRCTPEEIDQLKEKYSFFEHLALDVIIEKVDTMQMFGLPASLIKDNPRLLYQTSASELEHRLRLLQDESLLQADHVLKWKHLPHHLECNAHLFESGFQNLCAEKNAYEGCQSQKEYLCYRLRCSEQQAARLLSTYPLKRKVSQTKLKNLIDFILNEVKREPEFVIKYMKLCNISMKRLRHRYMVMQSANITSEKEMVYIWTMSSKKFISKYCDTLS